MLSVVITAWNEAKNLPRAVRSVADIADEVVVVDNASTDSTAGVAKSLGARVFHYPNSRYVEPVRNFSITKAEGDWILLLDADEEVSPELAGVIKKLLAGKSADYYRIPRKNLIFGRWIRSSHWWPDYVYRLFKKGHVTWKETIHSIPLTRGVGADLPAEGAIALIHHHYDSISQYLDRLNRYTDVQADELAQKDYKFAWADLLVKPADEFLTQYFARRGFGEGVHGLALALLQSVSALVLYLKMWQRAGFVETPVKLENVKGVVTAKKKEALWWYFQAKVDSAPQMFKAYWKFIRRVSFPGKKP